MKTKQSGPLPIAIAIEYMPSIQHLEKEDSEYWSIYLKEIILNQKETDILLIVSFKVQVCFPTTPGLGDVEENSVSYREIKKLHFLRTIGLCE